MQALPTTALLVIKDKKLLLAFSKNKQCFYLPGGKIDKGESATSALCREIAEELNIILTEDELQYYTHISAPAYGEEKGIIMEQDCFFVQRPLNPEPAAEIGELKYFSVSDYAREKKQAPGVLAVMAELNSNSLIN